MHLDPPSPTLTPTRRTLLRTAAWGVPAITLASTAPAFAASSAYDLRAQSFQITGPYNYASPGGQTGYYGPGRLSWTARICNDGPIDAPAGTQMAFLLGMGPYFDFFNVDDDGGLGLTTLGGRTQEPVTFGTDPYHRSSWAFRVNRTIPAGTCWDLSLSANLRRIPIPAYPTVKTPNSSIEHKGYNIFTHIRVTAPDGNETTNANNNDSSDNSRQIRVHVNGNTGSSAIEPDIPPLP